VRIPDITTEERNEIIVKMAERGISCNVHYKPLPMMSAYKALGWDIKDFPEAYNCYKNEITLPLNTKMTEEDVEYVIDNIKDGGFQFSDLLTINGSNWNDYLGAIIAGAIGGAAGGLGLNLFGTMLFAGTGQVIGDWIGGDIDSFGDAANTFLKAAFTAGLSYGITSAVSAGFGKLQMNSKILNGSSKNIKINAKIKNLTGSYGKALNGMKIGKNTTSQFLKQLAFTNSNMALTESTGGVISILLELGGF
jgi:hypothetical protein